MLGVRLTMTFTKAMSAISNSAQFAAMNSMQAIYSESLNQPAASACS